MKIFLPLFVIAALAFGAHAAPTTPTLTHEPVATALRGFPTPLHLKVDAHGVLLTQTVARIRLSEGGAPTTMPLSKEGGDYKVLVPVSMVEGVTVFWYSFDISNEKSETASTHWQRVIILEGAADGKGGAAAAKASGGGSGGGFPGGTPGKIVGGVILLGGAVVGVDALLDDDSGGGKKKPTTTPPTSTNRTTKTRTSPYACTTLSGLEQVTYGNLTVSNAFDINITVCRTCSNATISATGSWNASDSISNFNNPDCSPDVQSLSLTKPINRIPVPNGTYTIDVFSNGQLINSIPWPQDQDGSLFLKTGRRP